MTSPDPQPWFVAFLEAYVSDVRAGKEPDACRYDALFPGHEAAIREELSRLRDADSESEPSRVFERDVIGPYTIREELGRGGQGVVYLAEDPRLGRPVALKILRSEFGLDVSALKRFQRESVAVSQLDDPGLCTVYDSGVDDGVHYIAMRYVEGTSLRDVIRRRREGNDRFGPVVTPPSEGDDRGSSSRGSRDDIEAVVELFVQCARSLHVAHEAGVVHRDIKPGNIVVTPNGRPVILDFGLARFDREGLETLTDSGDLMGTPAYMAPEQVLGRLGAIDARTDIYSLGVALYECLVGVRPIQAPTRAELYSAIVGRDPASMRAHLTSIPRDLDVVVQRALEKDRARRYETAAEFADDLERFLQRRPVLARPVGPGRRLLRFYERSPVVAWSLTAALIGLIATSASWLRSEENRRWAERENAEYERLADARRHAELVAQADELWPARPHLIPAMEDWLRRARALAARAPEHRAALERLRHRGRLVSTRGPVERAPIGKGVIEEELRWSRAGVAHAERLRRQALRSEGEEDRDRRLEVIEDHAGRLEYRAEVLEDLLDEPSASSRLTRVWTFDDLAVGWRHDQLEGLVRAVESLVGGDGSATISGMEQRVRDAGRVARESILEHREAWERAATAVAQDDRFGDFILEPIAGLIPLGPTLKVGSRSSPFGGPDELRHAREATAPCRSIVIRRWSWCSFAAVASPSAPVVARSCPCRMNCLSRFDCAPSSSGSTRSRRNTGGRSWGACLRTIDRRTLSTTRRSSSRKRIRSSRSRGSRPWSLPAVSVSSCPPRLNGSTRRAPEDAGRSTMATMPAGSKAPTSTTPRGEGFSSWIRRRSSHGRTAIPFTGRSRRSAPTLSVCIRCRGTSASGVPMPTRFIAVMAGMRVMG